ncbi:MAG: AAA family ATPase [Chloroflexota bacterium]|nr:AAA family ATPase [Chloroflexota bacterium]
MTEGFPGFSQAAVSALLTPGVGERWAAAQAQLHPILASLAEQLNEAGRSRLPREWPLYEVSWKAARYRNRGRGQREPIEEYHFALDRAPRGAGIYVGVSGDERAILVGITSTGARKAELQRIWERSRSLWQPLLSELPDVRFIRPEAAQRGSDDEPWVDQYLRSRQAKYLWAGYRYSWDDPRIATPEFATTLIDDVLRLLPFNEALMEEAEALEYEADHAVRERRARYSVAANLPAVEVIIERINRRGFTFPDAVIRSYHVALQTKPLVILPGISGTGKTRLTRLYADAVYDLQSSSAPNPHYLIVAVQPDWHNAKDLLGYYNALTNTFHPTAFLRFLHQAAADPQQPYYVCLDELNLARPEYYLAPILSALETAEHAIDLAVPTSTVTTVDGETLRNPFTLPLNVHLTGTLNVDESTFSLSDKLLDRANVIELTDIDLRAFRQSYREPINGEAWQLIEQLEAILEAAGQPFGYRTIAEMLRYIETARGVLPVRAALDLQIKQKVLPKLRGEDSPRLRRALNQLYELFAGAAHNAQRDLPADAPFPDSAQKIRRMLERLDYEGFTDFYG